MPVFLKMAKGQLPKNKTSGNGHLPKKPGAQLKITR
jgi:hypothetical protein